ncbi:MAG: hypothetical protein M1819_005246 [Sarea resinae]|nr:MAG: hypothetical protein M1819_005246 [Sarea resinae]
MNLEAPPVLSTPDTHIFEDPTPAVVPATEKPLSDEELAITYEIERTVAEIRQGRWRRIALQFPDHMLGDAPRVFEALSRGLEHGRREDAKTGKTQGSQSQTENGLSDALDGIAISSTPAPAPAPASSPLPPEEDRLFILADTSYGACCVDEIAAEHVNADVVVHYGRACLSPTARLPVIYVFTCWPLAHDAVISAFKASYPDREQRIILMADVTYTNHMAGLHRRLTEEEGYAHIYAPDIIHNPSAALPNRTVPDDVKHDSANLKAYDLFHIADPPTSLLLTLSSRVASVRIYPVSTSTSTSTTTTSTTLLASSQRALSRRYGLLTSLTTAPILGILINTLSVKNYLHIVTHIQRLIAAAGKKSYTFVVGKVNAAKVANFSEIAGWVVVGCWESSLVESKDFWRPVVTPFELELALQPDEERVWTGEWRGDYQGILDRREDDSRCGRDEGESDLTNGGEKIDGDADADVKRDSQEATTTTTTIQHHLEPHTGDPQGQNQDQDQDQAISDPESAPPEYDLRTGRYVSHSRPMQMQPSHSQSHSHSHEPTTSPSPSSPSSPLSSSFSLSTSSHPHATTTTTLSTRAPTQIAQIAGLPSPGAEFLRSQRTWQGLGSDFQIAYEHDDDDDSKQGGGAVMEEGRRGIARGYTVGGGDGGGDGGFEGQGQGEGVGKGVGEGRR